MSKTIAVIGAFDTKGEDFAFVKAEIEKRGHIVLLINVGVLGGSPFEADISSERVAKAGGVGLKELRETRDRGMAMQVMTKGVTNIVRNLYNQGKIEGVFAMGGSAGTALGTSAMRALPIGVPKVMVSTLAALDTRAYVGTKDIVLFPSVVDVAGVNSISARIYVNAVGAIVGMVEASLTKINKKPLIAASMIGNTTLLVNCCRAILENHGYEVLLFHASGTGGQTMESLIEEGCIKGVLDVSLWEINNELVGGIMSAGPARLEAAARRGVPQVIVPGGLDLVGFWELSTVPAKFKGRLFYQWNPNVTLMRTTPEESGKLGRYLANKVNKSRGLVALFLPLKGLSTLDAPGKQFWWPEADKALFDAIRRHLRHDIPIYEIDSNINDEGLGKAVASKLIEFLNSS